MSSAFEIQIIDRDSLGKGNSRRMRTTGWVPAVLYGAKRDPRTLAVNANKLRLLMEKEAFYTSIVTLLEDKGSQSVIVKEIQRHPAKGNALHIDFLRVRDDELITLNVPLHFIGTDTAPGIKLQGGEFVRLLTDIEVTCLPGNLPEFIKVDITELELNEMIHLSEVKLPEGVDSTAIGLEQDPAVAAIQPPKLQEVEEEEEEELEDGEAPEDGEEGDSEDAPKEEETS